MNESVDYLIHSYLIDRIKMILEYEYTLIKDENLRKPLAKAIKGLIEFIDKCNEIGEKNE